ncbi:META domain-containing protein [Candidatus Chloroploca asiatica]|nr:META domain-containing protein [Candidatus Chloroploca asiatica]
MMRMKTLGFALLLAFAMIATLFGPGHPVALAQSDERCFAETGYCIRGTIREYWEQNGGLAVFGLPLGPQQAMMGEDGVTRQAQWFERHRLEIHPENAAPYNVLLGRIGVDTLGRQGRDWQSFPRPDSAAEADAERCALFRETGFIVCDEFLTAFRSYGLNFAGRPGITFEESLALFGYPISQPMTEVIEGKAYTVQWFERARFELHPENRPPFNVLFGRLGAETIEAPAMALQRGPWQLVAFGNVNAPQAAYAGQASTLAFDGSRASGSTGCNTFGGAYTVNNNQLSFGPLISTLIACAEPTLDAQEQAIFAGLQDVRSFTLAGNDLRISYDDGRQALVYRNIGAAALEAGAWQLVAFGDTNAPRPAAEEPATIMFDGMRVMGRTGCNNFNGGYSLDGTTVTFQPLATTLALCTSDTLAAQEQAVLAALQGARPFTIVNNELRIAYDQGRQTLVYRPSASRQSVVSGTVTYLPRIALLPNAIVQVQLVDISRADAPAVVLASDTYVSGGQQVPLPFVLPFNPAQINPAYTYAVQARITIDGQLRFISTTQNLVITRNNPTTLEVLVSPV